MLEPTTVYGIRTQPLSEHLDSVQMLRKVCELLYPDADLTPYVPKKHNEKLNLNDIDNGD